ncbi:3-phosphoserine/phosphohydroxythreonine transaminase [Zeimonas arvi]|uniref:Phosphoserine aminotransferase n=1 Tax=Zeimonas arvi TaxID=2498847 RepID=A0A5C8P4X7_9BURK|nr:3-phosphoserine/phosphohydroxythreonine transaminase [Zeimonas arvi]TXL68285.1 3-phosphoserine/phosphohydroxythreonine transaminase [Zeimonas arvi]
MSETVYNFSAGPAVLPKEVLRQVADELPDWHGTGMSVMEMSHRGPEFMGIHAQAVADLRELMRIPEHYKVLFMQGGAIAENAIVPMNLLRGGGHADYLVTGQWSARSAKEAARYARVNLVADAAKLPAPHRDGETGAYTFVPEQSQWRMSPDAAYLHLCTNETIDGVEFQRPPSQGAGPADVPAGVPIVVDVSSHVLSREIDVSRYGCLYGGAQKNIGPAGLTIVIVREDLIGRAHPLCPTAFDYKVVADNDSMYNTPPTFAIWVAGLVFAWLKRQGGVAAMEARNIEKAALLYDYIDASGLYENRVRRQDRSRMNVPFFLKDRALDADFLKGAESAGLLQLKGHRSVGGMRASLYNAMPIEGVRALVGYMKDFERRHG